jgi:asparagine synthase (glutamine-hydrolysing)
MCGVVGVAVMGGGSVSLRDERLAAMRDVLAHRGPDGAGLWRSPGGEVALGHRRLAVVDLSEAGAQPMVSACGRYALVYNGELYNDGELRRELEGLGYAFVGRSDAETLVNAWSAWGMAALRRLRGMFAVGVYDTLERRLVLARDPLGIKPLVWWQGPTRDGPAVVFASEAQALLAHPDVPARPDLVTLSAYLTTIRLTLGERTLFEGVRTVRPGEALEFDLRGGGEGGGGRGGRGGRGERGGWGGSSPRRVVHWRGGACGRGGAAREHAERVRGILGESVRAHLRSDVPVCALLSGGLDSSIVVCEATGLQPVRTYGSGSPAGPGEAPGDLEWAARTAEELGVAHAPVPIDRGVFLERWPEMVRNLGVPLGTPNEVAINEVARRLRGDGFVVALSGEGADEIFGGYEAPLEAAWAWAGRADAPGGGTDHLDGSAWVRRDVKGRLLNPAVWRAIEGDAALIGEYEREFAACLDECSEGDGEGGGPVDAQVRWQARLRMLRRVNLAGLLSRLDTAAMLEGIEGRTPLADRVVAEAGEALGMDAKWGGRTCRGVEAPGCRGGPEGPLGKLVLREAYRGIVPDGVIGRAKASFALPFERWLAHEAAGWLEGSGLAREVFAPEVVAGVCGALRAEQGAQVWTLAWPMVNVALWGTRWWG